MCLNGWAAVFCNYTMSMTNMIFMFWWYYFVLCFHVCCIFRQNLSLSLGSTVSQSRTCMHFFSYTSMMAALASISLCLICCLSCSFLETGTLRWLFFFFERWVGTLTSVENEKNVQLHKHSNLHNSAIYETHISHPKVNCDWNDVYLMLSKCNKRT